jgi:hypothetical protein
MYRFAAHFVESEPEQRRLRRSSGHEAHRVPARSGLHPGAGVRRLEAGRQAAGVQPDAGAPGRASRPRERQPVHRHAVRLVQAERHARDDHDRRVGPRGRPREAASVVPWTRQAGGSVESVPQATDDRGYHPLIPADASRWRGSRSELGMLEWALTNRKGRRLDRLRGREVVQPGVVGDGRVASRTRTSRCGRTCSSATGATCGRWRSSRGSEGAWEASFNPAVCPRSNIGCGTTRAPRSLTPTWQVPVPAGRRLRALSTWPATGTARRHARRRRPRAQGAAHDCVALRGRGRSRPVRARLPGGAALVADVYASRRSGLDQKYLDEMYDTLEGEGYAGRVVPAVERAAVSGRRKLRKAILTDKAFEHDGDPILRRTSTRGSAGGSGRRSVQARQVQEQRPPDRRCRALSMAYDLAGDMPGDFWMVDSMRLPFRRR